MRSGPASPIGTCATPTKFSMLPGSTAGSNDALPDVVELDAGAFAQELRATFRHRRRVVVGGSRGIGARSVMAHLGGWRRAGPCRSNLAGTSSTVIHTWQAGQRRPHDARQQSETRHAVCPAPVRLPAGQAPAVAHLAGGGHSASDDLRRARRGAEDVRCHRAVRLPARADRHRRRAGEARARRAAARVRSPSVASTSPCTTASRPTRPTTCCSAATRPPGRTAATRSSRSAAAR